MLALVDCNSCYASCEQIFRPDLRGKPIVVLSNNDGCVVTRNTEAKALDIPGFEPYFKLKHDLKRQHVHVFSSNYELYGDISARIMQLLNKFGSRMEVYSIDEAFLDVEGIAALRQHGLKIKQACWKEQRMPVCVGIAKTKTLAKLANHIAKKSLKLNGVCVIDNTDDWQAVFKKIPCKDIWGIGTKTSKKLSALGIHSAYDLQQQNPEYIRMHYSVLVEHTVRELNNQMCIPLELTQPNKKEIYCSRSFSYKVTLLHELKQCIASYAARACEKLRKQHSATDKIHINIQSSRFESNHYNRSIYVGLSTPTNDSRIIIAAALNALDEIFMAGYGYVRAGVGLSNLCQSTHEQTDLFSAKQSAHSQKVMQALDDINQRFGSGSMHLAAQGVDPSWAMARAMKSPCYSTRLSDVPIIKI
jgi:DNA polymerase V